MTSHPVFCVWAGQQEGPAAIPGPERQRGDGLHSQRPQVSQSDRQLPARRSADTATMYCTDNISFGNFHTVYHFLYITDIMVYYITSKVISSEGEKFTKMYCILRSDGKKSCEILMQLRPL